MSFNWTCPFCNSKTTVTEENYSVDSSKLYIKNADGAKIFKIKWVTCPNVECNKLALYTYLYEHNFRPNIWEEGEFLKEWRLLPETNAKVFPDYIPIAIRQDYEEAYAILTLSPKASATLSRRCIQGVIRDFWKVSKPRLVDEINEIKDKIDPLTWNSIDAIRKVGNIGAHMEKDINLIIDVDPTEALLLIQLIELLFEEWYIHRYEREQKLKSIISIATQKDELKKGN